MGEFNSDDRYIYYCGQEYLRRNGVVFIVNKESKMRCILVTQLCLNFCDSIGCRLPDSSVHGILQARTLEWVAMHSSRGSSQPRIKPLSPAAPALLADSLLLHHQGSPKITTYMLNMLFPGKRGKKK